MKRFIVYNQTGKILRTGMCPDDMIEMQANKDEFVMEGEANGVKHIIKDGKIVEYVKTPEDIAKEVKQKDLQEKERKITNKMQEILRTMAIAELTKEGEL